MPEISFVLSCYREGAMLNEAVDSIRDQQFKDWECIVVNDASPDDTTNAICEALAKDDDPRIRVIRRSENGGLSASRNTGIEAAAAKWVMPVDADDLLPKGAAEAIIRGIRKATDEGFVLGGLQAFGRYDQVVHPESVERSEILFRQVVPGICPFKKSVWERVGGYDIELSYGNQDWEFWMHVLRLGIGYSRIPEIIYLYRAREGSMVSSYGLRWPHIAEYMVQKHRPFFDEYQAASQFLANGYRRGSFAAHRSGDLAQAARWAAQAIWKGDRTRAMWSIFLRDGLRSLLRNREAVGGKA